VAGMRKGVRVGNPVGHWPVPATRPVEEGLRCHDVALALAGLVRPGAPFGQMAWTWRIGRAAALATAVRGEGLVRDVHLMTDLVWADDERHVLQALELLVCAGYAAQVQLDGDRVLSFVEAVPRHEVLYDTLGQLWEGGGPSDIERGVVTLLDGLASMPAPMTHLPDAFDTAPVTAAALDVAKAAGLVKTVTTIDGDVLYSPLLAFEHAEATADVLSTHGPGELREELATLRRHQGLPVSRSAFPALSDAVARGLVAAPSLEGPSHVLQPFACLPIAADPSLTTLRKSVLDKAMALLVCIRGAQRFGGTAALRSPRAVLHSLLAGATVAPSGVTGVGGDATLVRNRLLSVTIEGGRTVPRLIPTDDNIAAVRLASDLLRREEPLQYRESDAEEAAAVLTRPGTYLTPLATVQRCTDGSTISDGQLEKVMAVLMGRSQLERALADVMGRAPL